MRRTRRFAREANRATNRPSIANGAMRTSPTAEPDRISAIAWRPTLPSLQAGPPIPNRATSSRDQRSNTFRTPGCAHSASRTAGSSSRPGAWRDCTVAPIASPTRRNGSAPEPGRQNPPHSGTTVASTVEPIGASSSATAETAAPSPMPTTMPSRMRAPQDLARQPPDAAARDLPGIVQGRGKVHRAQPESIAKRVGRRRFDLRPIDDPDLHDPLGARLLEQARDLRPGHADQRGDLLLGLAQLVVQAADAHEGGEVAHGRRPSGRRAARLCWTDVHRGNDRSRRRARQPMLPPARGAVSPQGPGRSPRWRLR